MNIYLKNHSYKYAVEQIFLLFFPNERPVYPDVPPEPGENYCLCSISIKDKFATAHSRIVYNGRQADGFSRILSSELSGELVTNRLLQKIIKLSFYKAASRALETELPWGSITSVRPAKVAEQLLEQEQSPKKAEKIFIRNFLVSPSRAALCMDAAQTSLSIKKSLPEKGLSIYVGIPFCPTRCSYCSFVSSSVEKSFKLVSPYIQALLSEINYAGRLLRGVKISSVYIGGGTPTTLSADDLTLLMTALSDNFNIDCEYTVEAGRPDTITKDKLLAIKKCGATRISINPQTTSDNVLKTIGRSHSASQVFERYALAREIGVGDINMDLIAGLPNDSVPGFEKSLRDVIGLMPENITVHTLAIKKGSSLAQSSSSMPTADDVRQMLDLAENMLRSSGYRPYYLYRQKFMSGSFENIGWTIPGHENIYNVLMMEELQSILSFGAGGVSKLINTQTGKITRLCNAKYPIEYIKSEEKVKNDKEKIAAFFGV